MDGRHIMTDDTVDIGRRGLLRGRTRALPSAIRPPWSRLDRFTSLCTRCGACADACPEGILRAGDGGFPEVDFRLGECSFCGACADACPAPVFDRAAARPWDLMATIGAACLSARGVVCRSCQDACQHSAIRFTPSPGGVAHARVETHSCTGCGACVSICPVGAITMRTETGEGHAV
jgi:ferredoxin-type protein NapF